VEGEAKRFKSQYPTVETGGETKGYDIRLEQGSREVVEGEGTVPKEAKRAPVSGTTCTKHFSEVEPCGGT
jgi:hypothetical protein